MCHSENLSFKSNVYFYHFCSPPYWRKSWKNICKYLLLTYHLSTCAPNTYSRHIFIMWFVTGRSSMKLTQISKRRERSLMTWSPKWTATVSHHIYYHELICLMPSSPSYIVYFSPPSQWQRRSMNFRRFCRRRTRTWSRWRRDTNATWRRRERSVHLNRRWSPQHVALNKITRRCFFFFSLWFQGNRFYDQFCQWQRV